MSSFWLLDPGSAGLISTLAGAQSGLSGAHSSSTCTVSSSCLCATRQAQPPYSWRGASRCSACCSALQHGSVLENGTDQAPSKSCPLDLHFWLLSFFPPQPTHPPKVSSLPPALKRSRPWSLNSCDFHDLSGDGYTSCPGLGRDARRDPCTHLEQPAFQREYPLTPETLLETFPKRITIH